MKDLHFHIFLVTMTVIASISAATPTAPAAGGALSDECNQDFQKVTLCLDFATGKAPTPSKKCCDAIEDIKEKDPKCLCYVIQQAKTGGQALKDLGVQEVKLIQLPTACQLHNASISNCPNLLGISPSSPDAAVFTSNATTITPEAPAGKSPATPATSSEKGGSASIRDGHAVVALAITLITVSFVSTLPMMALA
ncbi:hypothetical protein Bca4012_071823 [Brassica carinata]|uniref:BnaCnng36210D protein n=3 Tax=Brassica TaxID=3705 RepID=A0A078J3C5_BRANA|nr:non-specific lipid transfer protein GPI-anchored 1 [Brassica napus]KAG2269520.1 hypothetical protein Bca52824_064075 [Brassica carinata]KAH0878668.1 hypothetical protein HID58_066062 [Brassica napus]CAF1928460.1 unnamed protein product [Brassica napus]CDY60398.1 BnaCnng36210D [Brassica napus]